MPDGAGPSSHRPTFNTLAREESFRNPPKNGSTYNILNEFVTPHIESFNSLFDDSGLPSGDGDGHGLLSLALKDIKERIVFDGHGSESGPDRWGNRMKSAFLCKDFIHLLRNSLVWIEQATIARPMVSEKDKTAIGRKVFPTEVTH